jgi:hypothetical protein
VTRHSNASITNGDLCVALNYGRDYLFNILATVLIVGINVNNDFNPMAQSSFKPCDESFG